LETLKEVEYLDPSDAILVFYLIGNVTYVYIVHRLIKTNDSPTIEAFVDLETTNELEKIVVIKVRIVVIICLVLSSLNFICRFATKLSDYRHARWWWDKRLRPNFARMCNREELPKDLMF